MNLSRRFPGRQWRAYRGLVRRANNRACRLADRNLRASFGNRASSSFTLENNALPVPSLDVVARGNSRSWVPVLRAYGVRFQADYRRVKAPNERIGPYNPWSRGSKFLTIHKSGVEKWARQFRRKLVNRMFVQEWKRERGL